MSRHINENVKARSSSLPEMTPSQPAVNNPGLLCVCSLLCQSQVWEEVWLLCLGTLPQHCLSLCNKESCLQVTAVSPVITAWKHPTHFPLEVVANFVSWWIVQCEEDNWITETGRLEVRGKLCKLCQLLKYTWNTKPVRGNLFGSSHEARTKMGSVMQSR